MATVLSRIEANTRLIKTKLNPGFRAWKRRHRQQSMAPVVGHWRHDQLDTLVGTAWAVLIGWMR